MIVLGLTGSIAAGKSTVARMLADRGAVVLDADRIARRLQEPGEACFQEIREAFGPGILTPSGRLDRTRLASLVFADADARRRLEAIMHPAIRARMAAELAAAEAAGRRLAVVEAALILEAGQRERYDWVVVAAAPPEVQLARLAARGLSEAEARRRLAAQWPTEAKAAAADFVIDTGGTLAVTEGQVAALVARLEGLGPRRGDASRAENP